MLEDIDIEEGLADCVEGFVLPEVWFHGIADRLRVFLEVGS